MAGTRLLLQTVALLELLGLALWSFYHGLCQNEDMLCQQLSDFVMVSKQPAQLPSLPSFPSLSKVQTSRLPPLDDPSSSLLSWEENPRAQTVCDDPDSDLALEHAVWWCPSSSSSSSLSSSTKNNKLVVRNSSLIIYGADDKSGDLLEDLSLLLFPKVVPPRETLMIQLLVEEQTSSTSASTSTTIRSTATVAQRWAQIMEDDVATLEQWPVVKDLNVHMKVVPPVTNQWLVVVQETFDDETTDDQEEEKETTVTSTTVSSSSLPKLTSAQVEALLATMMDDDHDDDDNSKLRLVVYVPATVTNEPTTWKVDDQNKLILVGGWNIAAVHEWLAAYMLGLPPQMNIEDLDSDGSFPTWYSEYYWHVTNDDLSQQIIQNFDRVQHLLGVNGNDKKWEQLLLDAETEAETGTQRHYSLQRLHQHLLDTLYSSSLSMHFPVEHYAAIFAPLLFPLLVPFLTSLVKEYKRYKEKKNKSNNDKNKDTNTNTNTNETDHPKEE